MAKAVTNGMTRQEALAVIAARTAARLRNSDLEDNTGFAENEITPELHAALEGAVDTFVRLLRTLGGLPETQPVRVAVP